MSANKPDFWTGLTNQIKSIFQPVFGGQIQATSIQPNGEHMPVHKTNQMEDATPSASTSVRLQAIFEQLSKYERELFKELEKTSDSPEILEQALIQHPRLQDTFSEIKRKEIFDRLENVSSDELFDKITNGDFDNEDFAFVMKLTDMLVSRGFRLKENQKDCLAFKMGSNGYTIAYALAHSGYPFSLDDLLSMKNSVTDDLYTVAHYSYNRNFTFEEILALGNPVTRSCGTLAHIMASSGNIHFTFDQLMALGNPANKGCETIAFCQMKTQNLSKLAPEKRKFFTFEELIQLEPPAQYKQQNLAIEQANSGFVFTPEQLIYIGDPRCFSGERLSILMAQEGYKFSINDIFKLNNPKDAYGATIAHWMAKKGHIFNLDELLKLGNPAIHYQWNNLHSYLVSITIDLATFDVPDEEKELYDDKGWGIIAHNGGTVAHIMAREHTYKFNETEIKALGDPRDIYNLSISDYQ
jgi:hypothetical protein